MFNLGPEDIKLVALLAERETFAQGQYGSKFYKSRTDDRSILNFTKVVNSSIRNFKSVDPGRMTRRLATLRERAVDLLNKLDISQECRKLVGSCVLIRDDSSALSSNFTNSLMDISQEISFPDKFDRLRYNDVWLYAGGKKDQKERKRANSPAIKKGKRKRPLQEDVSLSPDEILNGHFADRILEVAPSLFTRKELLADPEFSRALVKAIDEGMLNKRGKERVFSFKGKVYNFPELWNWKARDASGGKLEWAWAKAMDAKDKVDSWWPVAGTRRFFQGLGLEALEAFGVDIEEKFSHIEKEDLPDFLSVWNRQKSGHGQEFSFVFHNKLYDIRTGEELVTGIPGLLKRFATGKASSGKSDVFAAEGKRVQKIAATEAQKGNNSFVLKGKAYYLSGAEVDFEKAYQKAKKEFTGLGLRREKFPEQRKGEKP